MKVRCLSTEITNPDMPLSYSGWLHTEKYLTVGKIYEVYAIFKARNEQEVDKYLICPDIFDGTSYYWPTYIPTCYFEVIDNSKPSFWSISPKYPFFDGPLELNPEHYEDIVDGDSQAVGSFIRIRTLQNNRTNLMNLQQLKEQLGIIRAEPHTHLEYHGWHFDKHSDGVWKTSYKEREKETFVSLYPSEDIACYLFLQEIDPDNYTSWIPSDKMQQDQDWHCAKPDATSPIITKNELYTLKWENSNSIFIFIDSSIKSDAALQLFINKCFGIPHGWDDNWQEISKALKDLSWITDKSIIIIYIQFPDVDGESLRRFLSVIDSAVLHWRKKRNEKANMTFPYLDSFILKINDDIL